MAPYPKPDGLGGAYEIQLIKVSGYLVVGQRQHLTYRGSYEQLLVHYRNVRRHNLLLGWWSLYAIFFMPVALVGNREALGTLKAVAGC